MNELNKELSNDGSHVTGSSLCGFNAIEAMQETSQAAGWDCEYRQIEAGQIEATISTVDFESIALIQESTSRKLEVAATTPDSMFILLVAMSGNQTRINGRLLSSDRVIVMSPNTELYTMAPPGTDTLSVHIDKNVFESYITSMMPRWHFADNNGVQVLELANKANSLSRYALTALCAGSDGWLTESDFLEGLVQELGRARVADQTEDKYNRLNNRKTLMRLIAYIEENINNNIIMLDLCNYCAISQSTLQRLFLKEFGITPYNYVQARRLELARQFLMSNVDGKTIAEIAARSGFSHFGRFSTAYRHQFGVLPSESRQIV